MQLASVPERLNFNTKMVGPVIADFGSQETKKRFLPPTANPNSAETNAWHLLAAAGPPLACSALHDSNRYEAGHLRARCMLPRRRNASLSRLVAMLRATDAEIA
jgi:hypothetical protein